MATNYEKILQSIEEIKAQQQEIALSQRELTTNYTHIAEMANAHRNALYGSNGDVGLLSEMKEVHETVDEHEVQLNGKPGGEEGSIVFKVTKLTQQAGSVGKVFTAAITAVVISIVGIAFDFITKR